MEVVKEGTGQSFIVCLTISQGRSQDVYCKISDDKIQHWRWTDLTDTVKYLWLLVYFQCFL